MNSIFNPDDIYDIELELTTYCNAGCPLCYRNYKTFKDHYPKYIIRPLEEVKKDIDQFKNLNFIKLVGSISEPTIYKDFLELVSYIKSKGIRIEICTNGDTNNKDSGIWWKQLGHLLQDGDSVFFTICGSTQELHEVYRIGTDLERIKRNAAQLRSSRKIDYAQCIRFQYNSDDFDSEQFKESVKDFTNIYMTETYLKKDKSNYINETNLNRLLPNLKKQQHYLKVEKYATKLFQNKPKDYKNDCIAYHEGSVQIDINGNIYPCYLFLEASNGKTWNKNWNEILCGKYEVCKFCNSTIKAITEKDMHYII